MAFKGSFPTRDHFTDMAKRSVSTKVKKMKPSLKWSLFISAATARITRADGFSIVMVCKEGSVPIAIMLLAPVAGREALFGLGGERGIARIGQDK